MSLLAAAVCTYSFTVWNALNRKSEGPFLVKKSRSALSALEIGSRNCSLCQEDQQEIVLSNGVKFKACRAYQGEFRSALERAISSGRSITSVVGYRPSRSKGALDSAGRRTEFSRHAFGTALDVNEEHNGLYDRCLSWNGGCRLIKGGIYRPGHPLSITDGDIFVKSFSQVGFRWGGAIPGQQKDFMHFSLDGY